VPSAKSQLAETPAPIMNPNSAPGCTRIGAPYEAWIVENQLHSFPQARRIDGAKVRHVQLTKLPGRTISPLPKRRHSIDKLDPFHPIRERVSLFLSML
jgi:hypothetical protein